MKFFGKPQVEEVKLNVNQADISEGRNLDGSKGAVCNNCGGYGYTIKLKGGRLPCSFCKQTGAREETKEELQEKIARQGIQINGLINDLTLLKKALLETLQVKGLEINTNPEGTKHV